MSNKILMRLCSGRMKSYVRVAVKFVFKFSKYEGRSIPEGVNDASKSCPTICYFPCAIFHSIGRRKLLRKTVPLFAIVFSLTSIPQHFLRFNVYELFW